MAFQAIFPDFPAFVEGGETGSLFLAILRSRRVSQVAEDGVSGIQSHTITLIKTAGKPSRRKRSLQLAMGRVSPNARIPAARVPAKEEASGAAAMKIPSLKASSSRLKKKER